jgi:hypothetical protein
MSTESPTSAAAIIKIAEDTTRTLSEEANVIARTYHDLSTELAQPHLVGMTDLNWCGFAKWSSKAIGVSLRLDNDSPMWTRILSTFRVPKILGAPVRWAVRWLLGGSYRKALSLANRSIFLEIGTLYTNLTDNKPDDLVWRSASFATHKLNGPANDQMLCTGARLLRQAADDPHNRDELVLGASIALSAYEQARAQPALEFVFFRPVRWLTRISWRMPFYLVTRRPLRRYEIYTECHEQQRPLIQRLESWWARLYTRVLSLDIPPGSIYLARELVPPPGSADPLPLETQSNDDVRQLVERFRRRSDPERNRGVVNWLDYGDRMRFIVGYFMVYQKVQAMFRPPFPQTSRRHRIRRAVSRLPSMLSRMIPIPHIVDPSIAQLDKLELKPRSVSLSSLDTQAVASEPTCVCQSQRVALQLSGTKRSAA